MAAGPLPGDVARHEGVLTRLSPPAVHQSEGDTSMSLSLCTLWDSLPPALMLSLGPTLKLSCDASLARSHRHPGLIIRTSPAPDRWCRCPGQGRGRSCELASLCAAHSALNEASPGDTALRARH